MRSLAVIASVALALTNCKASKKDASALRSAEAPLASQSPAESAVASAETEPAPLTAAAPLEPSPSSPTPWTPGQWTRHRIGTSVLTYKILKHEADDYLVEVVSKNPAQRPTIMQVTLTMKSSQGVKDAQVKAAKMRLEGGKVQEVNGALLGPMQNIYKSLLAQVDLADIQKLPREDVTVAAGHFRGCIKNDKPVNIGGIVHKGTSWVHFSVPISALVKSTSPDGKAEMELLGFGLTGAKSDM